MKKKKVGIDQYDFSQNLIIISLFNDAVSYLWCGGKEDK
jgi:hypothetical protein